MGDCHEMICSFAQYLGHLIFAYHAHMKDLEENGNHVQSQDYYRQSVQSYNWSTMCL